MVGRTDEGDDSSVTAFEELCTAFDDAVSRASAGSIDTLTEVVELGETLLSRDDDSEPLDRVYVRYLQGLAYLNRFDVTLEADDRNSAIDALREVEKALPPESPAGPEVALYLGLALAHRLLQQSTTSSPDLTEAIDFLATALAAASAFDPDTVRTARQRLGSLLAVRFLLAGGDQDDHLRATGEQSKIIDDADSPPFLADSAHLGLALLALSGSTPVEMRRGITGLTSKVFEDLKNSTLAPGFAATADVASHHLGAISPQDSPFGTGLSMLQGLTRMMRNPKEASAEDIRLVRTSIEETQKDVDPESWESGLLTSMRVTLDTQLARLDGAHGDESAEPIDTLLEVLSRHGDHPARSFTRDLLGAIASRPVDGAFLLRSDIGSTIERLERALHELDDHPARSTALAKLTVLAVKQAIGSRSAESVIRIHGLLADSRARPSTSPRNDAILALLMGWTEAIRSRFEGDPDRTSAAIKLIQEAAERLPADDELHHLLAPQIYALLAQRYGMTRNLADLDAITDLDESAASSGSSEEPLTRVGAVARCMPRLLKVIAALARPGRLSPGRIDELGAELDEALALVPAEDLEAGGWGRLRGVVDMLRASHDETGADFPKSGPRLAAFRAAVQSFVDHGTTDKSLLDWTNEDASLLIGEAFASRDRHRLDDGIAMLTKEYVRSSGDGHERLVMLGQLGLAFRMRNLIWRRAQDLDNAITRLEEARLLALRDPGLPDSAPIFNQLGECYFTRGDTHRRDQTRAVAAGLDGLRARMKEVMIQAGVSRALDAALHAEGEAADVAHWCVAAGDHDSAVRALELGRAMVLHSATVDADTPDLLRACGRPDLAAGWEEQVGQDQAGLDGPIVTARMPSTLRRDVLLAIEGTETEQRLLSPPSVAQIAATLKQAEAVAMVYLVLQDESKAGFAVLVFSDGSTTEIPLPHLSVTARGPIDEFEDAQRDVQRARSGEDGDQAKRRWTKAAEALSDWAWPAAMGPLLDHVRSQGHRGVPRLVLAPVGRLGCVPWHAARRPVTGGLRYACQDAIVSYAASARQFVDAAGRGRRGWAKEPALVGVAGSTSLEDHLIWVEAEIAALERFYPGAGVGWPRQAVVRRLLPHKGGPGASLLHLSCHAVRTDPPLDSYLVLAGNTKLYVRDILRQAAQRPADADGGLVVLAACASDLTETSQDEALTLATAFLAGGAAGAVGTRWPVADLPTALFMIMFHHYLNSGYPAPPTALRAAQLWMLDPDRELPDWVTGLLAGTEKRPDLETMHHWAAFTYQGR